MFNKETISCAVCKHLVLRKDAKVVQDINNVAQLKEVYYCPKDAPPYEKKKENNFFKEMEVDEKGIPIGYKKVA